MQLITTMGKIAKLENRALAIGRIILLLTMLGGAGTMSVFAEKAKVKKEFYTLTAADIPNGAILTPPPKGGFFSTKGFFIWEIDGKLINIPHRNLFGPVALRPGYRTIDFSCGDNRNSAAGRFTFIAMPKENYTIYYSVDKKSAASVWVENSARKKVMESIQLRLEYRPVHVPFAFW